MSITPSPRPPAYASSPRTEITYEIETLEGVEQRELPFIIGVMSDLSATRDPAAPKLKDRRFTEITRDNFNDFLRAVAPRLRYKVENVLSGDADGPKITIELQFQALQDFEPDQVARQVTPLRKLLELRSRLSDLARSLRGNQKLAGLIQELSTNADMLERLAHTTPVSRSSLPAMRTREPEKRQHVERRQVEYVQRTEGGTGTSYIPVEQYASGESGAQAPYTPVPEAVPAAAPDTAVPDVDLMDRIVEESRMGYTPEERTRGKELIQTFVNELCEGAVVVSRSSEDMVAARVWQLDELLSQQMRRIMHTPDFQRLEAAWRGLHYLVMSTDMPSVKIKALDAAKRELWEAFTRSGKSVDPESSVFRKVFDETCGTVDGQPFTILLADYEFGRHPDDVGLLDRLSEIAEAANAPLVTNAAPDLFGLESFTHIPLMTELPKTFDNQVYIKWNLFRKRPQSRFAVVTLPHVLMRSPYSGDEDASFRFDEGVDGSDHSKYLWGGAAWMMASSLAYEFERSGFTAELRGLEQGGVGGMVAHHFRDGSGVRLKPPAEIAIDTRIAGALRTLGFSVMQCSADTDRAGFFDPVTCNSTRYMNVDPGDEACGVRLDYVLAVCRIAQYVRCILRDRAGRFDNAQKCEDYLNSWIRRYVAHESGGADPARPLLEAWFQVYSFAEAGLTVEAFLRPALRGGELKTPLRTCLSAAVFGKRLQEMVDEASERRARSSGRPRQQQLPAGRPEVTAFPAIDGTAPSLLQELLARLSAANGPGRELFLTHLSLAELLVALERSDAAAGLVESLLRQAKEFRLDRWESPSLIERLHRLAQLYLPEGARDADRSRHGEVVGPRALKSGDG